MRIEPVTLDTVEEARQVIFTGFLDYFSEIDYSLNPDLHNVLQTYSEKGNMFVVGAVEKRLSVQEPYTKKMRKQLVFVEYLY